MHYWGQAVRRLSARIAGDVKSRDFRFTKEWLSFGLTYEMRPKAPTEQLFGLYPKADGLHVEMGVVCYRRSNINPFELFCLKAVTTLCQPRQIFEIGTFDGATTLELARSAPTAQIFTIDLPPSVSTLVGADDREVEHARSGGVGSRFSGTAEALRITQLLGDSRLFDFSSYAGSIDLVFVDAGHEYEFVRADTVTALRLAAPGATVVWHDYQPGWPGVVRAVDELTDGRDIHHLAGTDFAILRVPGSA